nr:uncharacterized protein LOC111425467 isoform X2 [Onthophagus taurus]
MDRKMLYAFRGWIAFVAFMDLGTAVRSYIEKRSFLSKTMDADNTEFNDEEYTTSRMLGIYSILKALALIHCTLYIHYKPAVSMGISSLIVSIILYISETLYFKSATLNFYVVFPCILNAIFFFILIPHIDINIHNQVVSLHQQNIFQR